MGVLVLAERVVVVDNEVDVGADVDAVEVVVVEVVVVEVVAASLATSSDDVAEVQAPSVRTPTTSTSRRRTIHPWQHIGTIWR